MSTPTPAPGLTPSYQGNPTPAATPQSVQGNINQFLQNPAGTTGSAAGGGSAYFGQATIGPGSYGNLFQQNPNQGVRVTYGVYDPNALIQLSQRFSQGGSVFIDTTTAANMYYGWTQAQQDAFRAKMALVDSSYLTASDAALAAAWGGTNGLVQQSAAYAAAGKDVSPWDILAKDIASNAGGKGKYQGTQTRNIQTVNLTSAADANAIFTSAAQSLLGRAPTADELAAFRNNLSGLEKANPTNQTIEETFNPQGFMIDKNVLKSSGGIGAAAQQNLALQQAKTNPEYGAYQAATTYMGALQELLGGGKV